MSIGLLMLQRRLFFNFLGKLGPLLKTQNLLAGLLIQALTPLIFDKK